MTTHLPDNTLLHNGKYRITRFISSGGFGCTYEGVHCMLRSKVCIKEFFVRDYCGRDSISNDVTVLAGAREEVAHQLMRKFVEEAKAIFNMHHNGIVHVTDIFEERGTAYYVMEYIEGETLQELVNRKGKLTEQEAVGYIRQVCEALDYVHSLHRLHLDVKPSNVMVTPSGETILIDFGASKHYDEETNEETTEAILVNTPGYAPPEQMYRTLTTFSPQSDIYAVGATLYKLLTGITPPSSLNLCDDDEVMIALPREISYPIRQAVEKAMEIKRYDRPQNISEFISILDGNEAVVTNVSVPGGSDAEDYNYSCDPVEYEENVSGQSRNWLWLCLMLVSLVVICLAVLVFYKHVSRHRATPQSVEITTDSVVQDVYEYPAQ